MATAFERLDSNIQRVLWDMKWEALRDFQVHTIEAWFDRKSDLVLMADTASGKTEAAFLPILSTIAPDKGASSIRVLYVGPLKALINDQFRRVEDLCKRAEIPTCRWHGDVGAEKKHKLLKEPSGILLITPESLEALLMRRGRELRRLFSKLEAVVVDELHSFLDSERGRQLSSQLTRLDKVLESKHRPRRVGLSATIGDKSVAESWVSAGATVPAETIQSSTGRDVELLIKTFVHEAYTPPASPATDSESEDEREEAGAKPKKPDESSGLVSIAQHVFSNMKGKTNLVFCNSKSTIEKLADLLRRVSERDRIPNEFLVHHGSLSKQIRESVEAELQSQRSCTALCSSTLEMGIDVGVVDSIGQVGPPFSVNALKQRLGRSGRRADQPSRLWLYVDVPKRSPKDPLHDRLYPDLLQSVAMVDLMLQKWVEPPLSNDQDLSTLTQQVLSCIVQSGGIRAKDAYALLQKSPAFNQIWPQVFATLLKDLGSADLIEQAKNDDLILGLEGEKLCGHYDFYAAFETTEEYQVVSTSRHVGSIDFMPGFYQVGDVIILAGRRWEIIQIDDKKKVLSVKPSRKGRPLLWFGGGGPIHKRIREQMRDLLLGDQGRQWLTQASLDVLSWARDAAKDANLQKTQWVNDGAELYAFTWTGSRANHTLRLACRVAGFEPLDRGICLTFSNHITMDALKAVLKKFVAAPPSPEQVALDAYGEEVPAVGKHGLFLSNPLRARAYAAKHLNVPQAVEAASSLLKSAQ